MKKQLILSVMAVAALATGSVFGAAESGLPAETLDTVFTGLSSEAQDRIQSLSQAKKDELLEYLSYIPKGKRNNVVAAFAPMVDRVRFTTAAGRQVELPLSSVEGHSVAAVKAKLKSFGGADMFIIYKYGSKIKEEMSDDELAAALAGGRRNFSIMH